MWRYKGRLRDLGKPQGACGLCGNTGLRYQFMIVRVDTGEALWVGSACILNFSLTEKAAQARIRRAARKAEQEGGQWADEAQMTAVLEQLQRVYRHANQAEQRYLRWMAGKFQRRNGFSPGDIGWLFGAALACGERLDPACLPMIVRTRKDRQELARLSTSAKAWWENGQEHADRD